MKQQYYWIEIKFPFSGFWGTAFRFWDKLKKAKEKMLCKMGFWAFKFISKRKIRNPTRKILHSF